MDAVRRTIRLKCHDCVGTAVDGTLRSLISWLYFWDNCHGKMLPKELKGTLLADAVIPVV